ncbi:MAG TPA: hypothetical protein VF576_00500 [Rubricoccaceae bacterium]|jgi:hypothetical protein
MPRAARFAFGLAALALAACTGGGQTTSDGRYGHRADGWGPDGRETLLIAPPADSAGYFVYPAVVDSVAVRPERRAAAGEAVPVEVLVKGALPDACSALDAVTQARTGHFVTLALTMRQPRGAVCAQVVRPFRFYVRLDSLFEAGSYTLTLNGRVTPFQILAAPSEDP